MIYDYMIILDCREKEMIRFINETMEPDSFKIEPLHLGDVLISDKIIIERKQWNDLASSIIDGRYSEQSARLLQAKEEGYVVYYFLEGNLELYKPRGISKETLMSCVFSLTFEKGFFVVMTKTPKESVDYIIKFYNKYNKTTIPNSQKHGILTKKKNSQITKENISTLMLCQIPGIHSATCSILLEHFGTIQNIIYELNQNETLFEDFTYMKDSKKKSLNKNVIVALNQFLRK